MPRSKYDRPKANRVFTNREKPIARFNEARENLAADQHHILTFNGVGGQGKTALRKKFVQILAEENPRRAVWGVVDFDVISFREPARGLLEVRKTLCQSGPIRFIAFDVAITTYWEKAYPTEDISKALKDLLNDHESVLGSIVDHVPAWLELAQDLPAGLGLGVKALSYVRKKLKDSSAKRSVEALRGIEQLDATELLDKLPYFLGVDLRAHRERKDSRLPILFLDTYEALWSEKPDKTGFAAGETDAWLRELVASSLGVLFVIFGRDKLTWDQRFPDDWAGYLNDQHILGGLSEADADWFLRQIPIDEQDVRAAMIKAAQGNSEIGDVSESLGAHPFYLDLSVDTYLDIQTQGKTPKPDEFGKTHEQIIARFLRYRSSAEQATLKILSAPRAFDRELFVALVDHFQTGYPTTAWAEFVGFSFIEIGMDGRYRLHGLMRDHLQAALDEVTRTELQAFLFNWYDAQCQPVLPKDVKEEHEWALREAVNHRDLQDVERALQWFGKRWKIFFDAGRYAMIKPLICWALGLAEERLGDHSETAALLNNLAQLLQATNRLTEAEFLMRRALVIDEGSLGSEHPDVARDINNLAQLLHATNRLAEAETLMLRTLEINEKNLNPLHPNLATTLNNLAQLLISSNRLADAESLMRRALEITEKSSGPEHPNVAHILSNLSQLLQTTNRLVEAEPLIRRAMVINPKSSS